jgi:adhesin/invasin
MERDRLGSVVRTSALSLAVILFPTMPLRAQSYGTISTFAGTGTAGFSGDNGPAIGAQLKSPGRLEVDSSGNVYISDTANNRVRKVTPDGTITTVAGTGAASFGGDNGQAVNSQLNQPRAIIFDPAGNLYIADSGDNRVRKVTTDGIITTIAGNGTTGNAGDGGLAINAQLNNPNGLAFDPAGNLYIADAYNFKVRRVDPAGVITTYAGTGLPGSGGDGGPASGATLRQPYALAEDAAGNLYISDFSGQTIRRIDRTSGVITTFAGASAPGFSGDGGPATAAQLYGPTGMAFDSAGNLYFTDLYNQRVRKIDTSGIITTVAGDGTTSYTNDGELSLNAGIGSPIDVAIDAAGLMYVAQRDFNVVRVVALAQPSQIIVDGGTGQSTVAGTAFAQPLALHVIDSTGHALTGITVTFTAPASGASASLSSRTAITGDNGRTSVTATANFMAGSYRIMATVEGVNGPATFDLNNTPAPPSDISFVSQPADTPAGTPINAVTVRVTASGYPVTGTQVTMTTQGPGSVSGTTTGNTDSNGQATFSNLTITTTGSYQLRAAAGSVTMLSNSFNITGAVSRIVEVLSGNSQTAPAGTAYAAPLKVTIKDVYGNYVAAASVTFTAPSSGPSVTFGGSSTATAISDSNGVAVSPVLTANSQTGAVRVMAATSGASQSGVFDLMNAPGQNNSLAFAQQPTDTVSGQAIAPPVTLQLKDGSGNSLAMANVAVTIQMNPLTQRFVAIGGTTTQNTNAAGIATFANLSVSQTGSYQLVASATNFSSAQSNPFTIRTGSPASIATTGGTPQSTTIVTVFADPLAVSVRDASGNPVSGATVAFTAPASGASATLSAAQTTTDVNGRASVTATANGAVGSYAVTAAVSGVSATVSFALTNVAAGAAHLTFTQQPVSTTAGATISAVPVKLTDSGGNPLNGMAVTLSAAGGGGPLEGTVNGTTDITGTATFNDLRIKATGTYQLMAVSGALSALSNTFQITPATATNITVFDGNGQTAPVGAVYASPFRVSVADVFGNPIANAQVTFSAPASGASVTFASSATVASDISGIATSPIATANQTAGAFQVLATTAGAMQPATFNLTNAAGTANQLVFVQQPSGTPAGQVITPSVTVQLQDSFGNKVAMAGVNVTIQASPVAGRFRALSGTATEATDATGLASFTNLSLSQTGQYTLSAEASGITSATSNQFTITAGAAAAIQATGGTLQSITINTAFPDALQVLVTDAANNPVSGATVTFMAPGSGASAALASSSAITDATGHASVNALANNIAGGYTVNAATSGASGTASFSLTNLAAGAAHLVFVQQPASTTAGSTISAVSVRLTDSGNNPVSGTVVTLTAQGGSGTLGGDVTMTTDVTGTATFNDLVIQTAGTYQLQAAAETLSATSDSFQIAPAAAMNITVFDGNGQTAAVGTAYSELMRASVKDAFGNPVSNASVTFNAPAGGASVSFAGPTTVNTDALGIAAAPAATANGTPGTFQVTASTPAATQPATFNLTNVAASANRLGYKQQPTDTAAGQPIAPPVTVQLLDSFGNPVATAGVSVSLQASPIASLFRTLRGTASVNTDANGLATFPNVIIDQAGAYTLEAQANGIASATSNQFHITAGAAASIQASGGTPQTTTVLTAFPQALQVTVVDAQGNPVNSVTVSFTAPGMGASATLSAPSATTDAGGHASITATANGSAGNYTVTAAVAGVGSANFNLTNAAGDAAAIAFVQQPQSTTAGTVLAPVSASLTDSHGNPIGGIKLTVSLPGFPGILSGTTTVVTDAAGLATYTDLTIKAAGNYKLLVTGASLSASSDSFQITAATSGQTITAVDGSGQSAHVNTAYGGPLRALVVDSFHNPVVGATVTFTAPATGASVTFGAAASVITDSQGIATSPALTANAVAGPFTVTAATTGAATPASYSLTNLPGAASRLAFQQQPSNAAAGQAITPPVTVQLQDSAGNPVSQSGVVITLQSSAITQSSRSLGGTTSQPTNNAGLATFAGISDSQAGAHTLLATAPGVTSATSNPFTVTAGQAAVIQATGGTPQSTVINTAFTTALQATVTDALGNPVGGVIVSFTVPSSGTTASLSAPSATTDGSGHASVNATSNSVAGSYTVTAAAAGATGAASFALTNVAAAAASLTFVQQPGSTTAGATINVVTVRLTDSENNPVMGMVVGMSALLGSGPLEGTLTQTTDATGTATFSDLVINTVGAYQLRASTGLLSALSQLFKITAATAANITVFGGDGQSATVGTAYGTPLRARVTDQFGNSVQTAQVTFTAPPDGASVTFASSTTTTTDKDGIATASEATANQTAGLFQATAMTPGAPQPATFNLTNLAGTANTLVFVQHPTDTTAGQPITPPVTVQLHDSFGNPVTMAGISVNLQANPVSSAFRAVRGTTSAITDASGLATFPNVIINQAGDYTLTAVSAEVVSGASHSFNVASGAADLIQPTGGTPQTATILTKFTTALQVTVTDGLGNPASGVSVSFTAPGSGPSATLLASTATTDASGHASVNATANSSAGAYMVTAVAAGVGSAVFQLMNTVGPPASLAFIQQPQNTPAGTTMQPVTVGLADGGGNPIAGAQVTVGIPGFPGRLEGVTTVNTDATGLATFSALKITVAGSYTLQASTSGISATSTGFGITPATSGQTITVAGGSDQSAQVNTAFGGPLRAFVQDSFNNPVVGVAVTFTAPSAGASATFGDTATVNTDSQGIASSAALTANSQAGAFTVTAATAGAAAPASFSLTNLPGSASKLSFKQQPSDAIAGQTITPPVTVQLQDSAGNSVNQAGVMVTLLSSGVTRVAFSLGGTISATTDATGLATFPGVTESQAGTYTLLAQAAGFVSATSNPFTISAGAASAIHATAGTPQSAIIGAAFANSLQATVADSLGNPVSGVTVTFAAPASGASAALSAQSAVTDASGHVSVNATANNIAGVYSVTASASGFSGTAAFGLANLAAGAATLAFVQQPASTTAGATISAVTVKLTDSGNNPVSRTTVTMSAQGGSGALGGTLTMTTDITGTATFDDLVIQTTGTYQLRVAAGTLSALSDPFQIAPATSANITVFDGNGQSTVVGTAYGAPLRASVQDAFGNAVAGASVTFTAPANGASVTFAESTTVTTNTMGIAAAPVATANQTPGQFHVTAATAAALQPATFNLTNLPGTANRLAFAQQPTNTVAGQPVTPPVTVQIQDSFGNPVAMSGLSVGIQGNPVGSRFRKLGGVITVNTDATGLATFPNISIATAGAYTLTAEAAGFSSAASSPFNVTAGAAESIQATAGTPQSATILTAFPQALVATVKDSFGNLISGATVTFTAPASGPSATLSAGQAATDANGHATINATANTIAGNYAVQAAVAGGGSASFNLTNVGGGASTLAFTQQPVNTAAGSAISVAVKLTDGAGNPLAGMSVTLTVPDNSAALIGATTASTDAAGMASFANLSITTTGTFQLQATAGALSTLSNSFQITPAAIQTITPVDGGGQGAAINTAYGLPLRAVVRDSLGNAAPGVSVTFTVPANGAGASFAGSATVTTDNSGLATSPALTANSQTGSFQVTAATDGAASPATFNLTNLPGAANHLGFVQQPTSTVAGQIIAPPVTVQVKDGSGNPVAQAGVQVSLIFDTAAVVRTSPATAATDTTGLATFAALTIAQAGTYIAQAQAAGLASGQSGTFTISAGIPTAIQATGGTPQSAPVATPFAEMLEATLTDAGGNPMAGVPVVFQAPLAGAGGSFGGATSVTVPTDQQGRASAPFTANGIPGAYMVTATTAVVTGQAQFLLANLSTAPPSLAFAQQPANSAAGQTITPPVTVRIVNSSGTPLPVPGVLVALSLASGNGTLSGTVVQTTDNSGTATFGDLSIDLAGTKQLRAIAEQYSPVVSNSFQVTPGSAATVAVISGSPQAAVVSQLFPLLLQVKVTDTKGNPASGATVTFALPSTGAGGVFSGSPTVSTDANGVATAPPLTANNTPGNFTVTATAQGVAATASFNLTVLPSATGTLQVLPAQINFASESGQPAPAFQTVQILNSDGRTEPWTSVSSAPWLTVSPSASATPAPVNVMVDPSGLAPGSYSGTVTFTTPSGQEPLFVALTITAKPALVASPAALLFLGFQQEAPTAQTLSVTSTGRTIHYAVTASVTSPSGSSWLQVGKTQGQTPDTVQVSVNTSGLANGVYQGSVTVTATEAGVSGVTIPVTLAIGAAVQTPMILAVTNAGSFHPTGAPGALMTIFGSSLSDDVYQASTLPLPQTLGPASVSVNGAPAPLYYASPTQINFQMPSGQPVGLAQVVVNNAALKASSPNFPVVLSAVDPGLFVTPDGRASALNQDLTVHTAGTAQPAGAIIVVYLNGQGSTTPSVPDGAGAPFSPLALVNGQVNALIGGKPADVVFAGLAPGFVADTQVNVRIPQGLAPGDQPVIITINGVPSNAGVISVR